MSKNILYLCSLCIFTTQGWVWCIQKWLGHNFEQNYGEQGKYVYVAKSEDFDNSIKQMI